MRGIAALGVALATSGAGSAFAAAPDTTDLFPARGRIELSLGGFTPNSVETRTDDTSTWARFSVTARLGALSGPVSPFAFLDFGSQNGRVVDTDGFFQIRRRRSFVGLGMGWGASTRLPGTRWAIDSSVGAGLWFLEIADDFATVGGGSASDPSRVLDRSAAVGLRLRGAIRDPRGWFVESVWMDPGNLRGLGYAGASIAVGKRF
ncbi:MAG: hypothetical protein ACKO5K_04835 [Armatimonadota bacterium]